MNEFDQINIRASVKRTTGFDLETIWHASFPYRGLPYPGQWFGSSISGLNGVKKSSVTGKGFDGKTATTAPIRSEDTKTNKGGDLYAKGENGRLIFCPVWINGELLPICTISVSSKKVIVETPLNGKRGSVKELIRTEDYVFNIRGVCFGYKREFPEAKIELLRKIYELSESVEMKCALSDIFMPKGQKVVVKSLSLPDSKISEHVRPFEMEVVSDETFDLEIE